MLNRDVELLVEVDSDPYMLWQALGVVVGTHPLSPRPVREDTAVAFLSVQDADVGGCCPGRRRRI